MPPTGRGGAGTAQWNREPRPRSANRVERIPKCGLEERHPGRGHGSPTVVGQRVYLATADEQQGTQSVLCLDRETGKQLWHAEVHRGGLMQKNEKSTAASSTVACDGESVFINFANNGAVYVTALDLDGEQRWQTKIGDYLIHQGYGASPAVYQSLVIASADSDAGGVIAALDRKTGAIVWKRDRPKEPNYTSPIILNVAGRDQLFLTGCNLFSSFDPLSGKTHWEIKGATTECVTSTVTDGERVFSSGGYPKNHLAAVLADGSGNRLGHQRSRVRSLAPGERRAPVWRSRCGHRRLLEKRYGKATVEEAAGRGVQRLARVGGQHDLCDKRERRNLRLSSRPQQIRADCVNKLGDQAMASAAICGSRIYMRVAEQVDGQRQEMLYCLAKQK